MRAGESVARGGRLGRRRGECLAFGAPRAGRSVRRAEGAIAGLVFAIPGQALNSATVFRLSDARQRGDDPLDQGGAVVRRKPQRRHQRRNFNGMPVALRVGFRPTPSVFSPQEMRISKRENMTVQTRGDASHVPARSVVESAALALWDIILGETMGKLRLQRKSTRSTTKSPPVRRRMASAGRSARKAKDCASPPFPAGCRRQPRDRRCRKRSRSTQNRSALSMSRAYQACCPATSAVVRTERR
ncbi:MAG: hypothetical protein ACLRSW_17495 [Christensenellaceae bacterium]